MKPAYCTLELVTCTDARAALCAADGTVVEERTYGTGDALLLATTQCDRWMVAHAIPFLDHKTSRFYISMEA